MHVLHFATNSQFAPVCNWTVLSYKTCCGWGNQIVYLLYAMDMAASLNRAVIASDVISHLHTKLKVSLERVLDFHQLNTGDVVVLSESDTRYGLCFYINFFKRERSLTTYQTAPPKPTTCPGFGNLRPRNTSTYRVPDIERAQTRWNSVSMLRSWDMRA